ncbi:hypothetical protein VTK26DRAFT_3793 [Humicola hyalothermophila]
MLLLLIRRHGRPTATAAATNTPPILAGPRGRLDLHLTETELAAAAGALEGELGRAGGELRGVGLAQRVLAVEVEHELDGADRLVLAGAQELPPGQAGDVVDGLAQHRGGEEDGGDGDVARGEQQREDRQARVVAERPGRVAQRPPVQQVQLAQLLAQPRVRVVDQQVEGQRLEHQFLVGEDAVAPLPVFFALLVDDESRVLLRHLGHGDDEVFCLAAVLFRLVG